MENNDVRKNQQLSGWRIIIALLIGITVGIGGFVLYQNFEEQRGLEAKNQELIARNTALETQLAAETNNRETQLGQLTAENQDMTGRIAAMTKEQDRLSAQLKETQTAMGKSGSADKEALRQKEKEIQSLSASVGSLKTQLATARQEIKGKQDLIELDSDIITGYRLAVIGMLGAISSQDPDVLIQAATVTVAAFNRIESLEGQRNRILKVKN